MTNKTVCPIVCVCILQILFSVYSKVVELHTQDRMPLEQENLFLCLPPQELTDLEIFAPSNTRITFKIAKFDMS